MKILLVSLNNERDPYPVAPIGVAYIAKSLIENKHQIKIIDLCFVEDDYISIENIFKDFIPDVIGLSLRNIDNLTYNKSVSYLPRIKNIVDLIKSKTSVPLVIGGSGFSIFPEYILRYLGLEFGIIGEGEDAFSLLIEKMENDDDIYKTQNLCYINNGLYFSNSIVYNSFICKPDRSLLSNDLYLEFGGMGNVQTKRGCPFKCSYCTYPIIEGHKLRLREPYEVVEELKQINSDYGIDYVFFVDDIFNFPEEHAFEICEEILRSELKINWSCFATPKGMTKELTSIMKRSGCSGVEFGSDSGADKTLIGLGKSFTPDDIVAAAECCSNVALPDAHYIIIGGPDEDYVTLKETFNLFDKIMPDAIIALIGLRIYPNTLLHNRAIEEEIINGYEDLLNPIFYITPNANIDMIFQKVTDHARNRNNWIVPSLNLRYDSDMMTLLRRRVKRGPLWKSLNYE